LKHAPAIFKDCFFYSLSTFMTQAIGVVTSLALRKFLLPESMGVWTTVMLVVNYALFAELGIFTAVQVRIPFLRGQDDYHKIESLRNMAFTLAAVLSFLALVLFFLASWWLKSRYPESVIAGIRMAPFIISGTLVYNLYVTLLRADKLFGLLSRLIVFNAAAMCVLVLLCAGSFKEQGVYWAAFLAAAVSCAYAQLKVRYRVSWEFKPREYWALLKIGFPIIAGGVLYTLLISIDKLVIINMIGPRELGFYSIALLAFTYVNAFPKILSTVIFPRMQEEFGRVQCRKSMIPYVTGPALIGAVFYPVILVCVYYGLPVVVHYLLPKYIPGIPSMKIILIGCFFVSFSDMAHNFLITLNKQVMNIPLTGCTVIIGALAMFAAAKSGYGIVGVAIAAAATYFFYFALLFAYVLAHCESAAAICIFFVKICIPLCYIIALLFLFEHAVRGGSLFVRALIQSCLVAVAYFPVLWVVDRKTGYARRIWSNIRGKTQDYALD
jgi:O-antigen/teichoic acid export membrane protein